MTPSFAVGIDLGTSNTALAFAPLSAADPADGLQVFPVPQLVAAGVVGERPLLPSHLYVPGPELPEPQRSLPWGLQDRPVGSLAREQGARVPARHVFSAKSWLCHPAIDRSAALLPWGAPSGVPRLSPVEASARILRHLREAWDAAHPGAPLAEQDVVVTVPASFDEGARALTLRAAAEAGLPRLALLEEPQAAFYDFVRRHRGALDEALDGVRLVLVADIGGGTTDFTLIRAEVREGAPPLLERLAVGDHLLLGGDNMDLALARMVEPRLPGRLAASQWAELVQACRAAKELLLAPRAPASATVSVAGTGARLVGGTLSAELGREEARALLLDGFFPPVAADQGPARAPRTTGLAELGLPYAAEPAITRHAAAFLQRHAHTVEKALGPGAPAAARIDAVLFNGGALAPALVAERLVEVITSWRGSPPRRLANDAPDLAVARGAAQFALVRRGLGLRIGGGSPRTWFVAAARADGGTEAVCVVPRGAAEGAVVEIPQRTFGLLLGRPVRFRLLAASAFRPEQPGDVAPLDDELLELPPLQTVIEGEGTARVRLQAGLTGIGTLELWALGEAGARWKLEFELRAAEREGDAGMTTALPRGIEPAREQVRSVFAKKPVEGANVKELWRTLERILGDRAGWSAAANRDLWGVLWAGAARRRRSADHERVFLQLCGYLLRPGFGAPLDGWRAEQAFTLFAQGLTHHGEAPVWAAWWILWRRIAAGLGETAQTALFDAIAPHLRPPPKGRVANPGKKPPGLAVDEMVRLLGALERLPVARKLESGGWLVERLGVRAPGVAWALGRLGARVPVASAAEVVVPPEEAERWAERLLALDVRKVDDAPLALALLARASGDRARDLDPVLREQVARRLEECGSPPEWAASVRAPRELSEREEQRVFGESLPLGLHLA